MTFEMDATPQEKIKSIKGTKEMNKTIEEIIRYYDEDDAPDRVAKMVLMINGQLQQEKKQYLDGFIGYITGMPVTKSMTLGELKQLSADMGDFAEQFKKEQL